MLDGVGAGQVGAGSGVKLADDTVAHATAFEDVEFFVELRGFEVPLFVGSVAAVGSEADVVELAGVVS